MKITKEELVHQILSLKACIIDTAIRERSENGAEVTVAPGWIHVEIFSVARRYHLRHMAGLTYLSFPCLQKVIDRLEMAIKGEYQMILDILLSADLDLISRRLVGEDINLQEEFLKHYEKRVNEAYDFVHTQIRNRNWMPYNRYEKFGHNYRKVIRYGTGPGNFIVIPFLRDYNKWNTFYDKLREIAYRQSLEKS